MKTGRVIGGAGVALTRIGVCRAPGCGAPVFAELLTPGAPRRCFDCAPAFVERRESLGKLFERSGGRLPPGYARDPASYERERRPPGRARRR